MLYTYTIIKSVLIIIPSINNCHKHFLLITIIKIINHVNQKQLVNSLQPFQINSYKVVAFELIRSYTKNFLLGSFKTQRSYSERSSHVNISQHPTLKTNYRRHRLATIY